MLFQKTFFGGTLKNGKNLSSILHKWNKQKRHIIFGIIPMEQKSTFFNMEITNLYIGYFLRSNKAVKKDIAREKESLVMIFAIFTETNKVRLCYNCSLLLERSLWKKINTIGNNLVYVPLFKTPARKNPEKRRAMEALDRANTRMGSI